MSGQSRRTACTVILLGALAPISSAMAQGIAPGQSAFDNLIPTTGRSPGGMVNAGIGRAFDAVRVLDPIEITETEPVLSLLDQVRLDGVDLLVNEINDFFVFLVQRVFARAGFDVDPDATSFSTPLGTIDLSGPGGADTSATAKTTALRGAPGFKTHSSRAPR